MAVYSATQDFGTGKEAKFARQIVGATDELSSTTNAEAVKLMMIANSAAGWWNGLRQDYVRLLIAEVTLSVSGLVIKGSKRALEHAVGAQKASDGKVLTFAQKWCARDEEAGHSKCWEISVALPAVGS